MQIHPYFTVNQKQYLLTKQLTNSPHQNIAKPLEITRFSEAIC